MKKWSQKRILAMFMAVALVVSTFYVDVMPGTAAENNMVSSMDGEDISNPDASGSDVSTPDAGSTDGEDVSGSDVSDSDVTGSDLVSGNELTNVQEQAFLVTDKEGAFFGSYEDWAALLNDFKVKGNVEQAYVISVLEDAVIGKTMPSKAAEITLVSTSGERGTLLFASSTLNMTTSLVIEAEILLVADTGKTVNVNTKGKHLTLKDTTMVGTVKGTNKGTLTVNGDVVVKGNLQTFQYVKVNGTLQVTGNVSGVSNLVLTESVVHLTAGKSFTVSNVDATAGGAFGFPAEGVLPKAKIAGQVSGVLDLQLFQDTGDGYQEIEFAAGSKLLTAPKASVEQFALAGEGQTCYKKNNVLYVGAEVLMLYAGELYLDTYSQWSDVKARINALKDKTAEYKVVFLDDYVENGAFSMPAKGRYAALTLANGTGEYIDIKATGSFTMTADVVIGPGLRLNAGQISGSAWGLWLQTDSSVVTTGNITVKNLTLGTGARMQVGGKLTVKNLLDGTGDNELVLMQKKSAALKNAVVYDRIRIRIIDKDGEYVTPAPNTTIITASGTGCVSQFCLLDATEQELPLYSKGTAIKVRGDLATPIKLYWTIEGGEEFLGEYTTLAEVKSVIGRFKIADAQYRVEIGEELFVKGALPMPKAGTYKQITFSGEPIYTTGNITLTGNTMLQNKLVKVKSQTQKTPLAITWNLSKYTLMLSDGVLLENAGNVTGSAKSCLHIMGSEQQVINGNLKVEKLIFGNVLRVNGDITVTNVQTMSNNRLDYDLGKTVAIKGTVEGAEPLVLNPMRSGAQTVYTEGMKVLGNAPKLSVDSLKMAQETDWVLYKDGSVVRLGKALLTVFENTSDYESVQNAEYTGERQFARINDAIDYLNASEALDFVIRLEENIPSAGAFKAPVQGKNIVLCGLNGERKTLNLTGAITLDGCNLAVRNIELKSNSTTPGMILKNAATLLLQDTGINTLSAPAGTSVYLKGAVEIKGAVTGGCLMELSEDGVLKLGSNVTVDSLTLDGAEASNAELRLRLGKKMTVKGAVTTPEEGQFIINLVDANDKLSDISAGTVMVVTPLGKATQFKTENIMPGSFQAWNLIKKGDNIQTSEASQGDGEWSGDYL